jgi:hypothetical protein
MRILTGLGWTVVLSLMGSAMLFYMWVMNY